MPPRVPLAEIRAQGFDWPHLPVIDECQCTVGDTIELGETLGQLRVLREGLEGQVRAAQKMKAQTGADHSDLSDRYDELASRLFDTNTACKYVEEIIASFSKGAPAPPAPRGPSRRPGGGRRLGVVERNLREMPWPALLGVTAFFGALGALVLWLASSENQHWLLGPGAVFLGVALAALIWAAGIGAGALGRSARAAASNAIAVPRRRRILMGVGAAFALLLVLVVHNWLSWYGIHRDCTAAQDAKDPAVAVEHIDRATEAMDNPLLLLPTDLFDLHGPGRCRSAAREHGLSSD